MRPPLDVVAPVTVVAMRDRAIDYLLERQEASGVWRDFFLPAGESTDWVTAYVGLALAGNARGADAARRGWAYLETAVKPGGGWGYNALTPADADSTVWAVQLARAIRAGDGAVAQAGRAFLDTHRQPNGGISTYASEDAPRDYVGLPETVDFGAWTAPHVCVSAAAAGLGLDLGPRAYLVAAQAADGHWPSYWWFDPGYATAEAVEALGPDARAVDFAYNRLRDLLRDDIRSAFALAHVIRILGPTTPAEALEALATLQADNGSWPASARLRVPPPDCAMPTEDLPWRPWRGLTAMPTSLAQVIDMTFTITSLDHRRAFTTATVLRALDAVQR
jgi:hypothetical protein